jgi:hypothetical protein
MDGLGGREHRSPGCSWIGLLLTCITLISLGWEHDYKPLIIAGAILLIAFLWMGLKAFVTRD